MASVVTNVWLDSSPTATIVPKKIEIGDMHYRHPLMVTCAVIMAAGALMQQAAATNGSGESTTRVLPDQDDVQTAPQEELRNGGHHALTPTDRDVFARAFAAAGKGDWRTARGLAAQGRDSLAAKLVEWRYLSDRAGNASFAEIDAFLKSNPTWPGRDALLARTEAKLPRDQNPGVVIGWFAGREPVSAIGKIRLGLAELAAGKLDAGTNHLNRGWIEGSFDPAEEMYIVQQGGSRFGRTADRDRLDMLLWREDITAAKRQIARVSEADADIANARIKLRTARRDFEQIVAALPAVSRDDPALQFDLAKALRRAGDADKPAAILRRIRIADIARAHPEPVWHELTIAVRRILQNGDAKGAYAMASGAGFVPSHANGDTVSGTAAEYAEAQFLAGWISLRFLQDPKTALGHFRKFSTDVSRPISAARGDYWQGRALEALGDIPAAWGAYGRAARHSETFYGQLALARIDETPVLHVRQTPTGAAYAGFDADELVRAMGILADLGEQALLRRFALHYQTLHPEPGTSRKLTALMASFGYLPVAVRVAKAAAYDGIDLPAYTHPTVAVPAYIGSDAAPEKALVLGLIRQETEFDTAAVSRAGARGIMQVMPASAKSLARKIDVPYRPGALTVDAQYDMQLGMAEFAGYLNNWNGSLPLAAAAYNAGPGNARRWVAQFGDPRTAPVDPVDWIEEINFGETRNYVQRVLENLQVYRARLNGGTAPLRILKDLYGDNPTPKVLRYVPPPVTPDQSRPKGNRGKTNR
jgi:soluble lytic murein transglycosylase